VVAGVVGTAAMTVAEKVEQRFTGRPNSYVPAKALASLLGLGSQRGDHNLVLNHVMHWGTGIFVGVWRGVMAEAGFRGRRATCAHGVARLAFDQTLENATGVGSPPHTWPRGELAIDLTHKAIYAVVAGAVADRLVPAPASKAHDMSSLNDRDQTSHPPLVPMPPPTSKDEHEIRQAVEEARHRDPTAITGQAG
jgi:hypothetical protein